MPDGLPDTLEPPFEYSLAFMEPGHTLEFGDSTLIYPYKSVTKLFSALAILVAVDRAMIDLDDEILIAEGARTVRLRHLLSHTSGLAFNGPVLEAGVEEKRIYSNRGFEEASWAVESATGFRFSDWVEATVLEPLGLIETQIDGSAAYAGVGSIRDLVALARELEAPTLISQELAREAFSPVFAGLKGVTPGFGAYSDNTWGLGFEVKGAKVRTWFPRSASARTFGHFGQSGSLLWVDPVRERALAFLGAEPFGPWHKNHWQRIGDYFLETL
ncbi:MAG: serine hydrolase domain-containing protein [Actinomycetaceae bacterium]|nr:serine hydrolase domain-containing protein [Actinomycetaceae bacterium]